MFRAYDKATGDILAEIDLPAHQTGVPMTYMLKELLSRDPAEAVYEFRAEAP